MIINEKNVSLRDLTTAQLIKFDDALEAVFFKESHLFIRGEPFASTFRKDKKHFNELITLMISFKRKLMKFFQSQYDNRYNLVRMNVIKYAEDDDTDAYIYIDNWDDQQKELMGILEEYKRLAYELGITGLIIQTNKDVPHGSYDAGAIFTKQAKTVSITVNDVTKKRIIQAIKDSLDLNENKDQFEQRLKKIFVNPYRGRFIAQQEAIQSYRQGKAEAADENKELTKKTWRGVQPDPTEICGKVLNETVPIGQPFSNGLNSPDDTHYGCKCDLEYS